MFPLSSIERTIIWLITGIATVVFTLLFFILGPNIAYAIRKIGRPPGRKSRFVWVVFGVSVFLMIVGTAVASSAPDKTISPTITSSVSFQLTPSPVPTKTSDIVFPTPNVTSTSVPTTLPIIVNPPTIVITVISQPEPTYDKWCVIAESGALFFDTPVLIPANLYAVLSLHPGTKIYVVDEVGVHYKISQAEFNLGDQVEDFGPLMINQVVAGMPADKAGLEAGDIVISIDGIPVDNPIAFSDYTMNHLSQKMVLEIKRNNERLVFEVIPEIIQGAPRIGVMFSGGGKYTGIIQRDLPGYVPTYFVSCNPDIVNQNTTTKLPEALFSLEEPTTPTPSSSP